MLGEKDLVENRETFFSAGLDKGTVCQLKQNTVVDSLTAIRNGIVSRCGTQCYICS